MKDSKRKKIYMALSGVAIVAMMGISFVSIKGCTRSDVATSTDATAMDAVSEVTTVVDRTTEVTTTEKSKSNDKKGGSISGGVKKDHNTKEGTSEEKSDDNDTKTPGTTEYTGSTEEPTTQRQADNDDGSTKKPHKKDEGKEGDSGKKEPEKSTQQPVTPEKPEKPVKPDKPAEHVHTWKKHPAETHDVTKRVLVKEAWDEEKTTEVKHWFCGGCYMDLTAAGCISVEEIGSHVDNCKGGSSYYFDYVPVTETVHHDAVYEDRTITVTDKEAWEECTTCGAIRK